MKRKIIKGINLITKKIEKPIKNFYHKIPISSKIKFRLKNLYFTIFGFCLKNSPSYQIWKQTRVQKKKRKNIDYEIFLDTNVNKKIAVQLHLFYLDLLDEFFIYLNNIPYTFDLFVSVVDSSENEKIIEKYSKIRNVGKVEIIQVENRGRDVSPIMVYFKDKILKYDYLCHIHSKKSFYTGFEQTNWRKYLLDGLLGNENQVKKIFYYLETEPSIGLVYPETFPSLPYWGHTWLSNTQSREKLLLKMGIVDLNGDKYIDFPMGTMFWGRVEAFKPLLKINLNINDFQEEKGQVDGTLAHAFERCLGEIIRYYGYKIMTYDSGQDKFVYGNGKKNLNQYWIKNKDYLLNEINQYDVISFDIFDTLLMRKVVNPSTIFELVEKRLYKLDINYSFVKYRRKAEKTLRISNQKIDYSIYDIYLEMKNISGITEEMMNLILDIEISLEKEFVVPRKEMLDIFNKIKENKTVILVSDMYLNTDIIEGLLIQNGINGYNDIYISCEKQAKKEDGSLWKAIVNKYGINKVLHIGDNEVSDVQKAVDNGINVHHILSSKDLFSLTNIGVKCRFDTFNTIDSVMGGIILNRFFNDPYSQNKNKFNVTIDDPYVLGYVYVGPVIVDYLVWLIKKTESARFDVILFLAREGYLINKIYQIMKDKCKLKCDGVYFYTSRRASLVASISTKEDIKEALNVYYEGTLINLLKNRFGIKNVMNIEDCKISLPNDATTVYSKISNLHKLILKEAKKEQETYKQYIDSIINDKDKIAVSDIGYSGSIQYYLSKIVKKCIGGFYFATDSKQLPLKISGNTMSARYIENDPVQPLSSSYIHRYSLILETILTSPDNQFCYFENDKPVFSEGSNKEISKDVIMQIHEGAVDFADEVFSYLGELIFLIDGNKQIYEEVTRLIVEEDIVSKKLKDKFVIRDEFCTGGVINIFDKLSLNKN